MNADSFRQFYDYHFSENRKIWENFISSLTFTQFTQAVDYSIGSVRDQILHLISVDDAWFSELQGCEPLEAYTPTDSDDRDLIRSFWDRVEQRMHKYLDALQDETLVSKPITDPEEDNQLMTWQVLLQVANHGTDHRAQLLRVLHDLGVKTSSQDYIFYVYDHM